jgi:hypothetical protein
MKVWEMPWFEGPGARLQKIRLSMVFSWESQKSLNINSVLI